MDVFEDLEKIRFRLARLGVIGVRMRVDDSVRGEFSNQQSGDDIEGEERRKTD